MLDDQNTQPGARGLEQSKPRLSEARRMGKNPRGDPAGAQVQTGGFREDIRQSRDAPKYMNKADKPTKLDGSKYEEKTIR